MLYHAELFFECDLHALARTAVRRSARLCEAFWGEYAGDDRLILYLADRCDLLFLTVSTTSPQAHFESVWCLR
jgi:cob(I)alamin adenosyltransferase